MIVEQSESYMHFIQWSAVIGASLVAAVWDLRTRRIPNILTFPLLLTGILWSTWFGGAWGFLESIVAGIAVSVPFLVLYVFAGGGAGDVKLMAGIGAWLGLSTGLSALTFVVLSGGIMGIVLALSKGQLRPILLRLRKLVGAMMATVLFNRGRGFSGAGNAWVDHKTMVYMPYGLAIFCGVCLSATGYSPWPF